MWISNTQKATWNGVWNHDNYVLLQLRVAKSMISTMRWRFRWLQQVTLLNYDVDCVSMWFDRDYKSNPRSRSMFQLANLVGVRGFRLQDSHKTHDANVPIAGTYVQDWMLSHPLAFIKTVNHLSHFSIVLGWISTKNSKKSGFGRTMDKKFSFKSLNL